VLGPITRALPLLACVLWAGCGSSHSATVTSANAASGAIGKAQAQSYAREVNLAAADVPGSTVRSLERERTKASRAGLEFARCAGGVSPERRVVDIVSPKLRLGKAAQAVDVKSSVEVMPSAALAAQNEAASRGIRGRSCLTSLLPQVLGNVSSARVRFGPLHASPLPNLLPAGKESYGVRISTTLLSTTLAGKPIRLPLYLDQFDILAGPAAVNLSVSALGHPPPTATERRLLSLLYDRAQAHKL
jgi:hypothetical protein